MNILKWLGEWYKSNCDGDWEHSYKNVKIETLDNPGWGVFINLVDTELEEKEFTPLEIERDDINWVHCRVQNNRFEGFGGTGNLEEILTIFRKWATNTNAE